MATSDVHIIPLGRFDTANPTNGVITVIGWLVDTPLDENKLERAWYKLNAAWPILSARLKTNRRTGQWEFHVPSPSIAGSSACAFTTSVVPGSLASHYNYPKPSETISCVSTEMPHEYYSHPSRCSAKALLNKDVPVAALHVTRFDDASIVGISISHALADGAGTKEVMSALLRILRGEEVEPLITQDAFATYKSDSNVPAPEGLRIFSMFHMIVALFFVFWDWIRSPRTRFRLLYIPAKELAHIKKRAMEEISSERGDQDEKGSPWISTSDAVFAFLLKCVFASEKRSRSLSIAYMANIRKHLPSVIPSTYIRNATMVIPVSLPSASSIPSTSMGSIALAVRHRLQSYSRPAAVDQYVQWRLAHPHKIPMFMEPAGLWMAMTNWREMGFMHFDWTPAAVDPRVEKAKCLYLHAFGYTDFQLRNSFLIGPDDPSGGLWVLGSLSKAVWEDRNGFGKYWTR
ncbi:hypothetical protein PUNSTDRAFT_47556 [Punctularia strigosozonata HHB-11173 SS5]|uniref:Uncharacterized protein n=1 Tax=Punctularia strigosozonata (strain HHB-11173) TaxID=741275 RepID=R7S269_PUNST|nr:uncharacterized protein PUNSTDRAFT_47556 [Punctularia strigosozonata HHB-11173 SS5]EIN04288.1 hypothetical protein PUNSTDRAFT_47556 [Punctularia strigosozonata HHB-11173 SS5]